MIRGRSVAWIAATTAAVVLFACAFASVDGPTQRRAAVPTLAEQSTDATPVADLTVHGLVTVACPAPAAAPKIDRCRGRAAYAPASASRVLELAPKTSPPPGA